LQKKLKNFKIINPGFVGELLKKGIKSKQDADVIIKSIIITRECGINFKEFIKSKNNNLKTLIL